jgi:hypothetical protein
MVVSFGMLWGSVVEAEIRVAGVPIFELLLSHFADHAFAFLKLADELLALAIDDVQIVIGELAPLLITLPVICFLLPLMRSSFIG